MATSVTKGIRIVTEFCACVTDRNGGHTGLCHHLRAPNRRWLFYGLGLERIRDAILAARATSRATPEDRGVYDAACAQ